jgi:hypothetical protein
MRSISLLSLLGLVASVNAHFLLLYPTPIGFDDDAEGEGPCGGFDPTTATNFTNFPIEGGAISYLNTHSPVTWEFQAALTSNLTHWVNLTPTLNQTGAGYYCNPLIPGPASWVGKNAILRIVEHGMEDMKDMILYQVSHVCQVYILGRRLLTS